MRVAIHFQHLLGSGHLVRMRHLAAALHRAGHPVCLISGGPIQGVAAYEAVQLPTARTRPGDFTTLLDSRGEVVDDAWKRHRRAQLIAHLERFRPDVLVVETWPFGRRQLEFEILPMLDHVRRWDSPPDIVASIRDVLQARKQSRRQETLERISQYLSLVMVHGDQRLVDLSASFPEAREIGCPVRYSGYIAADPAGCDGGAAGTGEVVVSAGGGATGEKLLETAVASACSQDSMPWRVLAGSRVPDGLLKRWRARQNPCLVVERNRSDFLGLLSRCKVSVSQFGYNTATDILRAGCPAVVVPYAADGETEQATRARRFAALGVVHELPESDLGPGSLRKAVRLASIQPVADIPADLDGASRSVTILENLFHST